MKTSCQVAKAGVTRRGFLGLAAASAVIAGSGIAGCSPAKPSETGADAEQAQTVPEIAESEIKETKEADVVVVGLGVAGVAAMRSAAEAGAHVIAVEKTSIANCRSSMFAAFNCDTARKLGIPDTDPTEIGNELMTQMAHRADYRVINTWLKHCGEAFEWYTGAYKDLLLLGPEDAFPENPDQIYLYAESVGGSTYRPGIDHEHMFAACCCVGGGDETHRPILEANIEKALETGNAEAVYDSPAVKLETKDGKVSAVVCKNLQDGTYTRYAASKGVILASGDYSYNDEMLQKYAPWVYAHKDNYLFSHEAMDCKGNHASTGDGQQLGISVGGHLDIAPHAIMAHIFQFGVENFIELNERGERFCNEDLSMTNIAKVILNQPGSKVFQIIDAKANDYYPIDEMLPMMRSYGDGETYSAEADTLEELAAKLGFDNDAASTFVASIERYNELCEKGHDDDFGKAAEKMHPIIEPPFKAVTYDTLKHTSVEDVSCMRLLVTMGGLVTDTNARVLDDDLNPIQGLYAVGNVQGGRFVDDYPFSLSGASHAAALTYGYLAGEHIVNGETAE